jgi:diguanylate cyclase (GGDEF)-like protein
VSSAPQPSDYHDALTELPNRRLFDDRLNQALPIAQRRESGVALALLSLGGFATLPDDTVREAARRLGLALRKGDTLARWGAGEFALLLIDVAHEAHCRVIAERLLEALDMDVAIGMARFPADAQDAAALVRNADAARARARERGRRQYRIYAR